MEENRNPEGDQERCDQNQEQTEDETITERIHREFGDAYSYDEHDNTGRRNKPPFAARFLRIAWRRRRWHKLGGYEGPNWAEQVVVILTVGILTVGALQYFVYKKQAKLMHDALDQNERQIILGQGQLALGSRNARAAENNLAATINQFQLDQRAWVGAEGQLISRKTVNDTLDTIDFRIALKNSGKTPALRAQLFVGYLMLRRNYLIKSDIGAHGAGLSPPDKPGPDRSVSTILPNDTAYTSDFGFNIHHMPRQFMQEAPSGWFFIGGEVDYDDIFQHHHVTTFAQKLEGKTISFANIHNEMN